jgi:Ca-activated chloride channel family protein
VPLGFRRRVAAFLAAAACLAAAALLFAQVYRERIDLVVVTATVTDKDGRPVLGLHREDFSVYEDGVEQPIAQFTGERAPISLGILVDISDSMFGERIADARKAIDRFVLDLLAPEDEAFLMVFNHAPDLVQGWTQPPRGLAGRLDNVKPFGGTAIYDALVRVGPILAKRRHQRCGLVIISDGEDTASDVRLQEALLALNRTDAFVYAIAIDAPTGPAINRHFAPNALRDITGQNGGYTAVIHASGDLTEATERIANELNHQYTLGFAAPHGADGKYHLLRVRTHDSNLWARSRRGYYAIAK